MAADRGRLSTQTQGKSLIDRITPNNRSRANKEQERKVGLTVVNGKLVRADDVGVLLRQATLTVESRKVSQLRKKNLRSQKNGNIAKKGFNADHRSPRSRKRPAHKEENKLVISTNADASDRVLLFKNLALGVNQDSLKTVLQQLSNARIGKVRVKDLPSGSATANVWLLNPSAQELERVRKFFDGALVDGRTIQVSTVSESSQKLSY